MTKENEYKSALAVPLGRLSIDGIVQEICQHPEYLDHIYHLTYDNDTSIAWRAIWVCEKVSEIHPQWLLPYYDEITKRLCTCQHQGSKRLYLSILFNLPHPSAISIELLNFCFDHALAIEESIAVQALSIKMAYKLCIHEKELMNELKLILENAETDFYSQGVKNTISSVLKKINKV